MPNRSTRDELILAALSQAMVPNLEVHDAPEGVVLPEAFCIEWLQDIIDFWYHLVPFSTTVKEVVLNCTANSDVVVLPSDFIIDVRNGYEVQQIPGNVNSYGRLTRVSLQRFRRYRLMSQQNNPASNRTINYPVYYNIVGDDGLDTQYQTMRITPTPTISTIGRLWYYALPPKLSANDIPKMPNDYVCKEYLRIRCKEWIGRYDPGTAQKFCDKIIGSMKAAGLMNEPEDDEIGMAEDHVHYNTGYVTSYNWMGPV